MGDSSNPGARLNQFLASCGLGSRRGCETLVTEGRVEVNGAICVKLATRITDSDTVKVDGKMVRQGKALTILLNKPRGFLCTRDPDESRRTIYDLLPHRYHRLHSVGRLDLDSSGLLLLTSSGDLTHALTHPSHGVEKEYHVALNRPFDARDGDRMLQGIELEEGKAVADSIKRLSNKQLLVVLHQGLNRQIRRMFSTLDYDVRHLERVRIGQLEARNLAPGKWRPMSSKDLRLAQGQD